jgi:hypothetical protein
MRRAPVGDPGFDPSGDVIVNYPAGRDGSRVRRVYRRGECVRAWLCFGSDGVAYLVYQEGSASDRAVDDVRDSN